MPRWQAVGVGVLAVALTGSLITDSMGSGHPRTLEGAHAQAHPFAEDSPWTLPVPEMPVLDPGSGGMVGALAQNGQALAFIYEFGVPVFVADQYTPTYSVRCTQDWLPCPVEGEQVTIPLEAEVEADGSGAMVVIDPGRERIYDFLEPRRTPAGDWEAARASWTPLGGDGRPGVSGAGFNLLAGVVRTSEIRAGRIDHALVFNSGLACVERYRYPATQSSGTSTAPTCLPEGARIQLDPAVDVDAIPGITPGERAVAKALQIYGAYLGGETAGPMGFLFERPTYDADPYPVAASFLWDYFALSRIPWSRVRVLHQWNGK